MSDIGGIPLDHAVLKVSFSVEEAARTFEEAAARLVETLERYSIRPNDSYACGICLTDDPCGHRGGGEA